MIMVMVSLPLSADDTVFEGYVFGKSYHTNRDYDWNENNYGLGVGMTYDCKTIVKPSAIVATYRDSLNRKNTLAMVGPRIDFGWSSGFNGCIGASAGYFSTSCFNHTAGIVYAGIGYDRVNLMVTGYPKWVDMDSNPNTSTGMVAVFLKIRVATF